MTSKHKKRKKHKNKVLVICMLLVLCLAAAFLLMFYAWPKTVDAELGAPVDYSPEDFIFYVFNMQGCEPAFITDMSAIDGHSCGSFDVDVQYGWWTKHSTLVISDTTAPVGTLVSEPSYYVGSELLAESFFEDIKDEQKVEAKFAEDYSFTSIGKQDVTVTLTDESGNSSEYSFSVDVREDSEAPAVVSIPALYFKIGEERPDALSGLEYEDNVSNKENIKVSFDDSAVNYTTPGVYFIKITLEDECGNKMEAERRVNVYNLSVGELFFCDYDENLDKLVSDVLSSIITDDMTDRQKIVACYNWVYRNLVYKASEDHSFLEDPKASVTSFATKLLATKKGACFAYAAVGAYMMNKLDIPVILLIGLGSNVYGGMELHCWNQVYCEGAWYHYDAMYEQLFAQQYHFCLKQSWELYNCTHQWDTTKYPWS